MPKTVYSLVLSEDIVAAVDRMAARAGLSRSALVAQVLADYASVQTPEALAGLALKALQQTAAASHLRTVSTSAVALTLRTSLCCKYNPALRYTVELGGRHEGFGQLRISLRSQNNTVLEYFSLFLDLWCAFEQKHLDSPPRAAAQLREPKRFLRTLRQPAGAELEAVGRTAGEYILLFDACMQAFFEHVGDALGAVSEAEELYLSGLQRHPELQAL